MAILRELWTDEVEDEEVRDKFKKTSRAYLRVGNEKFTKSARKTKCVLRSTSGTSFFQSGR